MNTSAPPRRVCVVVGAGTKYASSAAFYGDAPSEGVPDDVKWGLGGALPIAFAREGYDVVIMSRSRSNLEPIATHIEQSMGGVCTPIACDVTDSRSVAAAFSRVRERHGDVDVLCYNAGYDQSAGTTRVTGNPVGGQSIEDIEESRFDMAYAVHASGLLRCGQQVLPSMRARKSGCLLVSGNTMSLRGSPRFGLNAPSKFAQRAITQVMAQEYKPFGVHVALVIVDGPLDAPGMRRLLAEQGNASALQREDASPGSTFLAPGQVARTFVYLAEQHPSVWTHEITLTPFGETLGHRL